MGVRRRSGRALLLVVALLALAHAHSVRAGLDHGGWTKAADHLFSLVFAAGLLTLCYAAGRTLLERLGLDRLRELEWIGFATGVGIWVLATTLLLLGLAGLFRPWAIGVVLVAAAVASREALAGLPAALRRVWEGIRAELGPAHYLAGATLAVFAAFLLLHASMPPLAWDDLMYHLEVPDEFLEHGRLLVPADNLHVAFTGTLHMLYAVGLAFGAPTVPALVSALAALLLAAGVYAFVRRLDGPFAAACTSAAIWGFPAVFFVAKTARLDTTLALLVFLGHYALYLSHRERRTDCFYLAAALLGVAVSVKYHGGAYLLALSPFVLWVGLRRLDTDARMRVLTGFGAATLVVVLPWLVKNWVLLGSPVYPFLAERLLPPWLAEVYGQSVHPAGVGRDIYTALGQTRETFNLRDFFFAPEDVTIENEGVFYNGSVLFALLPLVVALARERHPWVWLPPLLYVAAIVLSFGEINLRYLVPAAPMLTAGAVLATRSALDRMLSRRTAATMLLVVLLATLARPLYAGYEYTVRRRGLEHVAGGISTWELLIERGNPSLFTYAQLTDYGRQPLPPDARVLMLFEARGYYFEQVGMDAIQDNVLTNWPLLAASPAVDRCLGGTGITHLLFNAGPLRYYVRRGLRPETLRLDRFGSFAHRCLETVRFDPGRYVLYRVLEEPREEEAGPTWGASDSAAVEEPPGPGEAGATGHAPGTVGEARPFSTGDGAAP